MKSEPVESEALETMCKYIRTPKYPEDEFKCVLSLARMLVMPRGLVPKTEALSDCRPVCDTLRAITKGTTCTAKIFRVWPDRRLYKIYVEVVSNAVYPSSLRLEPSEIMQIGSTNPRAGWRGNRYQTWSPTTQPLSTCRSQSSRPPLLISPESSRSRQPRRCRPPSQCLACRSSLLSFSLCLCFLRSPAPPSSQAPGQQVAVPLLLGLYVLLVALC